MERVLTEGERQIARDHGYDSNGLRFSIQELQNMVPRDLSMESLSEFVDAVTFVKVRTGDTDFFRGQLVDAPVGTRVSATGLGNLAYVALHIKDDEIRSRASSLFHRLTASFPKTT